MNVRFRKWIASMMALAMIFSAPSGFARAASDEVTSVLENTTEQTSTDGESTGGILKNDDTGEKDIDLSGQTDLLKDISEVHTDLSSATGEENTEIYGEMTEYYIAPNGNDENPGTMELPKRTAAGVADLLKPGDTVIFREGSYNGVLVLQNIGSSEEEPITIKACEGEEVILTSDNSQYIIFLGHCQNVRIEGLTFSGKDGTLRGNGIDIVNFDPALQQTRDITVTNCRFVDCDPAFLVRDVITGQDTDMKFGNMEFSNNIIMSSDPENKISKGIALQEMRIAEGCTGLIYNNLILNAKWSLHLWGRSENVLVYNNTFLDTYDKANGSGQFDIYPVQGAYNRNLYDLDISHNCVFKNNIFTKPIRTQLEGGSNLLDADKGNFFDSNLYDAESLTDYVTYNYGGEGPTLTFEEMQSYQGVGHEANGKYASVEFVDRESDGHLSGATNPANSGAAETIIEGISAPETDLEGSSRNGEFGAYAYDGSLVYVGANENAGTGSFRNPYPSIQAAIEAGAQNIQVKAGSYTEDGLAVPAGTAIRPYDSDEVFLTGAVTLTGGDTATNVSNICFEGTVSAGQNAVLEGCTFKDVLTLTGEGASVQASYAEAGIVLNQASEIKVVNTLFTNAAVGLTLNSSTDISVWNNTFFGNTTDLSVDTGSTAEVHNNIFSAESSISGTVNSSYNCYNSNTLSEEYLSGITESNTVKADPQFISERSGDYRLYRSSLCVSAGLDDPAAPQKDINGVIRGTPCSIGAYELVDVQNIYYVSPEGDDSAAGTSNAPFKTIGAAVAALRPGEQVVIRDGTYEETVTIEDKELFQGDGFSLKAEGSGAVLNGSLAISNSQGISISGLTVHSQGTALTIVDSAGILLEDMFLSGTSGLSMQDSSTEASQLVVENTDNFGVAVNLNGGSLNLTRASISGAGTAISASDAAELILTSSVITNSTTGILSVGESALHVINNTFYNVSGFSVDASQQIEETALNLYNNIFSRSVKTGAPFVHINKASGFGIGTNIYDADAQQTIIMTADNTNRTLAEMQEDGYETGSFAAAPMLKDPVGGNFSPMKGSPAARGGQTVLHSPALDYNGTNFADVPDIGAVYSPFTLNTYHVVPYGLGWGWYDQAPDGSWDRPFTTLKEALNVVNSSDTILIHKGVYDWGRNDIVDLNGTEDAPITICACTDSDCWYCQSYDNKSFSGCPEDAPALERPVLTGPQKYDFADPSIDSESDLCMKLTNCSYITIRGLEIAGFAGAGIWVYGGDHIVLDDLHIYNIDSKQDITSGVEGFLLNDITNSIIRNNRIWNIGYTRRSHADHGIYAGGISNCTFSENVIIDAPGGGMQFYSGDSYNIHANDCKIENNVFYQNRFGLILCGVEGFNLVNNTFVNSLEDDLYLDWTVTNNRFANNLFYNSLTAATNPLKVNPSLIARHDGSGDNKVIGNTFTNSLYDYQGNTPYAQEGWGNLQSFESFVEAQAGVNTFTDFYSGNAGFLSSKADETLSHAERAAQVDNELFRTTFQSSGVNKGNPENAPVYDRDGNLREGAPDIGAYEAQDVRVMILSENSMEENNSIGATVGTFSVLGQEPTSSDLYTLVSGEGSDDNDCFLLEGNELKAAISFDYETKSSYSIRVKVDANGYVEEKTFVISVINVEETPKVDHWVQVTDETIIPDGKLDEKAWEGQFTELLVGQDNSTEFRARAALLADEGSLYLAVQVTDSEICNRLTQGVDFNADMVEVYLDGYNLESSVYDEATVQFQFRWEDSNLWIYGNSKAFSNVKFAMVAAEDGYVLETAIPWKDLGVSFSLDHTIGLTATVQDYDASSGSFKSLAMVEGENFWNNSSQWETYGFWKEKEDDADDTSVIIPPVPHTGWTQNANGDWYYYKEDGQKATGWLKYNNNWYYFDEDGILAENTWICDTNGVWYFLGENGKMATGWLYHNGSWYYLYSWGGMACSAWVKDQNIWYYLGSSGGMATGWQWINGVWYYLYSWGGMACSGWVKYQNAWYYLDHSGAMAENTWICHANDKWYYVGQDGKMAVSCVTPDGYHVDEFGVWIG